jgi:predicted nucleotidyltransferase
MYGLKTDVLQQIQLVFEQYPSIRRVILYGSRAKGNYRQGSDIDLTLEGEELDLSILQKIEDDLDDLLLPYKLDVSLLKHIKNNDLLDHIKGVGIVFYEK